MLGLYPDAAKYGNPAANTPLHLAVQNRVPDKILKAIFTAYPDAAKMANYDGDLPLHLAISKKSPDAAVLSILDAWPEAAMVRWRP